MNAPDPTVARIESAILDSIRAGEFGRDITAGMLNSWVIIGAYTDQSGTERQLLLTANRQPLHITVGLIKTGDVMWSEGLRRWLLDQQRRDD